ncbi:MAG TPA: hypothetical protein VMV48_07465 [Gallionellaceae bacterium]|nr:hypothetical protein [Gallionellaceae bacterium]
MKPGNNLLRLYLLKEFFHENWKGLIFVFLLLSIVFAILFAGTSPIVTSKKRLGVLEREDYGVFRGSGGVRKRIFYIQLSDERAIVIAPFEVPFRKGENVIVFEDIRKSGFRNFRFAGYENETANPAFKRDALTRAP